ncbi:DUF3102 domain-containing protein [Leptospira sp. GIMC2001]|uniref:DUF3102 domain-containing protein n=1 Tax=Leptospira sp. GIMC2001 TaxID=1513297 RepID=UPI00234A420A|nr:DUF3102 domain-containing protein [Leptospira sp. GIMC2001]WCL50741.1 DUF3102 domain-containing protein [Leptospira sp. GIMC2001]
MKSRIGSITGPRPGSSNNKEVIKVEVDRTIQEIVELHNSTIGNLNNAIQNSILIGEKLSAKKRELGHGNWLPWVESNLPFQERMARNYIRMYENRDFLNRQPVADLKSAIKLLSDENQSQAKPEDSPRLLYNRWKMGGQVSKKEKALIKELLQQTYQATESKLSKIKKELSKL